MNLTDDLYQEVIIEEYRSPQNKGVLNDADVMLQDGNASCGDSLTIYLKLDAQKQKITDLKWDGVGCAISMAAMSVLSAKVKGMEIAEMIKLTQKDLEEMLGLENITEARVKCLLLGLSTLKKYK